MLCEPVVMATGQQAPTRPIEARLAAATRAPTVTTARPVHCCSPPRLVLFLSSQIPFADHSSMKTVCIARCMLQTSFATVI